MSSGQCSKSVQGCAGCCAGLCRTLTTNHCLVADDADFGAYNASVYFKLFKSIQICFLYFALLLQSNFANGKSAKSKLSRRREYTVLSDVDESR